MNFGLDVRIILWLDEYFSLVKTSEIGIEEPHIYREK
jgi:hypothetical protein